MRNREIGFIFQSFNLIGDLSVAENVELPLTYRSATCRAAERKRRTNEALDRVGMSHRGPASAEPTLRRPAAARRRGAGVGRAARAVLLADEPTGNLDSRNGEAVMGLLDDLHANGATICMVTHDEVSRSAPPARSIFSTGAWSKTSPSPQRRPNRLPSPPEGRRYFSRKCSKTCASVGVPSCEGPLFT